MELTLESAFSAQGALGHLAYLVLIASMLMRTLVWLRILVIASAILGIIYASLILHDPVSTFWETLLVLVNVIQLLLSHISSLRARFSEVEETFMALHMRGLTRGEARKVLDAGEWISLPKETVLSIEGQAVDHLFYIGAGTADVIVGDTRVATCEATHFVGEMTAARGLPTTATVVISSPTCELWRIEAASLRGILERDDNISHMLDAAFARNYRDKLSRMNQWAAGAAATP